MKVNELMNRRLITVKMEKSVAEAFAIIINEEVRHLPVVDGDGRIVGILSDRDIRNVVVIDDQNPAKSRAYHVPNSVRVAHLMVRNPAVIEPEDDVRKAIAIMNHRRISCLPVVAEGKLIGILTTRDLMCALSLVLGKIADEKSRKVQRILNGDQWPISSAGTGRCAT